MFSKVLSFRVGRLQNFVVLTHYHTMPHFDALNIYSCEKHCEKRRNCLLVISNFSFSHNFFYPMWHLLTSIFHLKCTLALSQTSPGFYVSAAKVFYPLGKLSAFFSSKVKLLSANSFSLEKSKTCRLGKD